MSSQKKSDVRRNRLATCTHTSEVLKYAPRLGSYYVTMLMKISRTRQGSYAQNCSAVRGLVGGKLLLTLSATNYFNSKHAKSFVYYEIKFDLQLTTALPNRSK